MNALKMYAKNRQMAQAVQLGRVSLNWLNYAIDLANSLENTSLAALEQREKMNVKGTEIENYNQLTEFYNQRYFEQVNLPEALTVLEGVHHLRFGVLEQGATIPFHLDEPYTLRFICMVKGSHKYHTETGAVFPMLEGEVWFINGSFKHSIENTSPGVRIALLGKFNRSESNLKLINELLRT